MRGPDAGALLGRALATAAQQAGCAVRIAAAEQRPWHSATFAGARHVFTLSGRASSGLASWLESIAEAEFALRGHLVADVVVERVSVAQGRCEVVIEALTVAE